MSYSVKSQILNPPNTVLNEIICYKFIMLVKVSHSYIKPSFYHSVVIIFGSIGVGNNTAAIIGTCKLRPFIIPIRRWQIIFPKIICAAMIEDHILNYLYAFFVGFCHKFLVQFIISVPRVNFVKVCHCISVV